MHFTAQDVFWMEEAFKLAKKAQDEGEVPIGAVIVKEDKILGRGWNQPISTHDPTNHAEINAIRKTCQKMSNYRIPGMTLYITLEPCVMCLEAIVNARISKVIFGAFDSKDYSKFYEKNSDLRNHYYHNIKNLSITGGLLEEKGSKLLKDFFKARRSN